MKLISSGNTGKNEPFGVMGTFVVRLAMPVRRPSAATLPVKGEMRRFIHEAEDLVVFARDLYKMEINKISGIAGNPARPINRPLLMAG